MTGLIRIRCIPGWAMAICLMAGYARAGQSVVDAGATFLFTVPATATNYAWQMDGTVVGTNGPGYTYMTAGGDVGTHLLTCDQTLTNGVVSNTQWQVRARITLPTSGTNYYVATNGLDSNPGTLASPFLTLERARNAVRTNGVATGGVSIWIRGGLYRRTNTFALTGSDSGRADSPVVYRAYAGETPVFTTGTIINSNSFTPLNAGLWPRVMAGVTASNILELDLVALGITNKGPFPAKYVRCPIVNPYLPSSDGGLCELFFNGQRQRLSRYPNDNLTNRWLTPYMKMNGVIFKTGTNYLGTNIGGMFYFNPADESHIQRWQTAVAETNLWIQGFWRVPWESEGLRVWRIDTNGNTIATASGATPGSTGFGNKYSAADGSYNEPYCAVNLLEEIDQPGEWSVDFYRKKLYFLPPGPVTNGAVVISDFAAPVFELNGCSNVVVSGLSFNISLAQGMVITNSTNNLVQGCSFSNLGSYAVDLNYGRSNGVVSCNLSDLAAGGIYVLGGSETSPRAPCNHYVVNNDITNFALVVPVYAAGIDAGFGGMAGGGGGGGHTVCVGARIAHNHLAATPHGPLIRGSYDKVFEYNRIEEYCTISGDFGGIYSYMTTSQGGYDTVRFNYLYCPTNYLFPTYLNPGPIGGIGIQVDGCMTGEKLYGNIATGARGSFGGGGLGADGAQFYNNLAVNAGPTFVMDMVGSPAVYAYNVAALGNTAITGDQTGPNFAYATDPGFLNWTNRDLRLKPDSRIYTDLLYFKTIPFEMIGLYNDELRSNVPGFGPYVTSTSATAITPTNAVAQGQLYFPQFDSNTTALVYYGITDGGSNAPSWSQSRNAGVFAAGPVSGTVTGLLNGTTYYFRYFVSNAFGTAWSPASASFRTLPPPGSPVPVITNVTPSLTMNQNNLVTFTGRVFLATGPTYPPTGAPVQVIINGVVRSGTVTNATGDFSVTFSVFGIPPSVTPYPVTYFYPGDPVLNSATNTSTTVTLNALPQPVVTASSRSVPQSSFILTGQVSASGPVYPAVGDDVSVTINGLTQSGSIIDAVGNFAVPFDFFSFGISTNVYPVTYRYAGSTNLNSATNSGTTVTICPPNLFWTGTAGTNFETGGVGGNWNNYGAPVDDLVSSTVMFSNTPTANQPSLTQSRSIEGLLFATATGGWTLGSGSATQVLSVGGNGISTVGQTSGTNRIAAGLDVAASQTWQADTGGNLLITGSITNRANATTNYSLTINAGGSLGNVILSPAAGNRITLNGSNNTASIFQVKAGGLLELGGDGVNAPLTTSSNYINNTQTTSSYGTWGINAPGKVQVNSGIWITGDLGRNGGDSLSGTLEVKGGLISFAGARYLAGGTINVSGGVLRFANTNSWIVNGGQFSLGYFNSGTQSVLNLSGNGVVDLAKAGSAGGNSIGYAIGSLFNQSGGLFQNGLTPGQSTTTTFKIGAGGTYANNLSAVTLTGGTFISGGTVQYGGSTGTGNTNNFNFMGGVLALDSYNAANLGSSPTATASANQTAASVANGTLANYGGTLAPGNTNKPGRTVITGSYAVSNAAARLAVEIGGTTQANAFTNALSYYDYVSVSSNVYLGGALTVNLTNDFVPVASNTFTILTAGNSLTGMFNNLVSSRVAVVNVPGASFQVLSNATSIVLTNYSPAVVAAFTASRTNGVAPLTVTFTDTSTGLITNRFWDFGDGVTSNATVTTVVHTYSTPSTNQASLVVRGAFNSNTNWATIEVGTPTILAAFTASPTSGVVPVTVTLMDTSTGTITNRFWDFGDGFTTNTLATNVSHTYTNAKIYQVTLVVGGPVGASTNTQTIVVIPRQSPPVVTSVQWLSSNQLLVTGTNGSGPDYVLISSTNLVLSVSNWMRRATNPFGPGGGFSFTVGMNTNVDPAPEFFRVLVP